MKTSADYIGDESLEDRIVEEDSFCPGVNRKVNGTKDEVKEGVAAQAGANDRSKRIKSMEAGEEPVDTNMSVLDQLIEYQKVMYSKGKKSSGNR